MIARRIVHRAAPDRLNSIMSTRYQYIDWDGEPSDLNSALELAIDTHRWPLSIVISRPPLMRNDIALSSCRQARHRTVSFAVTAVYDDISESQQW